MKEIFVLIVHTMTGSGDITHQVMGPMDEHRCHVMLEEIMDLDARVSESHALVLQCREATPREMETLRERAARPSTTST